MVTAVVTIGTVCALGVFGNHSFSGSGGSQPSERLGSAVLRLAGAEVALPPSQLPQRLGIGVAAGPSDIGGWCD